MMTEPIRAPVYGPPGDSRWSRRNCAPDPEIEENGGAERGETKAGVWGAMSGCTTALLLGNWAAVGGDGSVSVCATIDTVNGWADVISNMQSRA